MEKQDVQKLNKRAKAQDKIDYSEREHKNTRFRG